MFLARDEIKQRVKNIIMDEFDNDIIFIVANKGIGKLTLLGEIYDLNLYNKDIIIANGKRVHCDGSSIKKCFIDGICSYIERNNFSNIVKREAYRRTLIKLFRENNILDYFYHVPVSFYFKREIDCFQIIKWLSRADVSIATLKAIYVEIAGKTPLIIVSEAMKFSVSDREYLLNLQADTLQAKITYIIASRASEKDSRFIRDILNEKDMRVRVFPLLPNIVKPAEKEVDSLAEISLIDIGKSDSYETFIKNMLSGNDYYEVYNLVQSLVTKGFKPQHIFFLANQEMSLHHFEYLRKVINKIYHRDSVIDKRLVLPHEGRLLWLDALSYYLTLHEGIDKAIADTQVFFFDILNNAHCFTYGKPEKNKFKAFLKEARAKASNDIAKGFSTYFSDLAALVFYFSSEEEHLCCSYEQSLRIVEILDKTIIQFSESSIRALELIHEQTQICYILDIGLETMARYFKTIGSRTEISNETFEAISTFQSICMKEAYRWNDATLLSKIIELQRNIIASGNSIKIKFDELTKNKEKEFLYQTLLELLRTKELEVEDIFMRKTIFLSYAHVDKKIADMVDRLLLEKGFDVKRDERDVKTWESLSEFMKSIRKQDYVVLLISDTYLHRENCVYEVYQLLKDSNYINRTFPIAIEFNEEEILERRENEKSLSMFNVFYWTEILKYWTQYVEQVDGKIKELPRELTVELDLKYRELIEMVHSLNIMFNDSFNEKLLGTIGQTKVKQDVKNVVERITEILNEN